MLHQSLHAPPPPCSLRGCSLLLLFWELKSLLIGGGGRLNVCDDSVSECDINVSAFHFKDEMISEQHQGRSTLPPPKQAMEN